MATSVAATAAAHLKLLQGTKNKKQKWGKQKRFGLIVSKCLLLQSNYVCATPFSAHHTRVPVRHTTSGRTARQLSPHTAHPQHTTAADAVSLQQRWQRGSSARDLHNESGG